MSNFLELEPVNDTSNKWRNIVAIFAIVFGIGITVFFQFDFSFLEKKTTEFVSESFPVIGDRVFDESVVQAGGDVIIEPPREIQPRLPALTGELLGPDQFSAVSIVVKDQESGMILYAKEGYKEHPIASVTKLMSALVLLEKDLNWGQEVEVVGLDSLDTHMYAGEIYTMEDLWSAALVGSSNKAVLSMATAIDWPIEAFVERMNQKALELGMSNTHFTDPTGLDATNSSSASDVVLLLDEVMRTDLIRETLLLKEHTIEARNKNKRHHMWSTNWLLLGWIPNQFFDLRGGKTGYIPQSGYNFVMQVANAEGHTLNVVIFGAKNHEARFIEARDIVESVFEVYQWPTDTQQERELRETR